MTVILFIRFVVLTFGIAGALVGVQSDLGAQENNIEKTFDLEEFQVVGGIEASQQLSLDIRRSSANLVDAISSEYIGQLPDKNVAEALQRIPGVAINRIRGEGGLVSVRGLGPQFVRVSINGRTAPSNVDGQRSFSFDQLQSEIVETLEVYKTAQADLLEGGLAGTINVKTRRPLDLGRRVFSASAFGTYNTLSGNTDPRTSAMFSDVNSDETFGYLFAASFDDRTIRQDNLNVPDYQVRNFDLDKDGSNEVGGFFPGNVQAFMVLEERERINLNSSFQWKPSSSVSAVVDVVYTKFDRTALNYGLPFRTQAGIGKKAVQVEAADGIVTFFETSGAKPRSNVTKNAAESELLSVGGNLDIQVNDKLKLELDLSHSENENLGNNRRTFYDQGGVFATYDIRDNNYLPVISLATDLNDASLYSQGRLSTSEPKSNDEELMFRADATYNVFSGIIDTLKAGVTYRDRERRFASRELLVPTFIGSPLTGVKHSGFPVNDYLSGIDASSYPRGWAVPDIDDVFNTFLNERRSEIPQSVFDDQNAGVSMDYIITEETLAGYIMGNISGQMGDVPVSGNIGVRVVDTEQTSTGNVQPIEGFEVVPGTTVPTFIFGSPELQSYTETYTEYLPSTNINFDLQENLRFRIAAGKVLTRPSFVDLNPGTASANASTRVVVSGNPTLKPLTAWQYDIGLEYYLSESSFVAVNAFRKDVDSFINVVSTVEEFIDPSTGSPIPDPDDPSTNVVLSRVSPRNETGASIEGVEFVFQRKFDFLPAPFDSMGGVFNYTYITSDAAFVNPNNGALFDVPGLSENVFNFILYYEKDAWTVRFAYNVRDKFLASISDSRGNPRFTRSFAQLDGSINYSINDQWDVIFEAVNITDENVEDYNLAGQSSRELLRFTNNTGRRFFAGVRLKL